MVCLGPNLQKFLSIVSWTTALERTIPAANTHCRGELFTEIRKHTSTRVQVVIVKGPPQWPTSTSYSLSSEVYINFQANTTFWEPVKNMSTGEGISDSNHSTCQAYAWRLNYPVLTLHSHSEIWICQTWKGRGGYKNDQEGRPISSEIGAGV